MLDIVLLSIRYLANRLDGFVLNLSYCGDCLNSLDTLGFGIPYFFIVISSLNLFNRLSKYLVKLIECCLTFVISQTLCLVNGLTLGVSLFSHSLNSLWSYRSLHLNGTDIVSALSLLIFNICITSPLVNGLLSRSKDLVYLT